MLLFKEKRKGSNLSNDKQVGKFNITSEGHSKKKVY